MDSSATAADAFRAMAFDDIPVEGLGAEGPRPSEGAEGEPSGSAHRIQGGAHAADRDDAPWPFPLHPLGSLKLDRSSPWLIKGLLPSSGLHVIYGAPATGKSFVALHAGLHVAVGRSWGGRRVTPSGVVYVASEGSLGFHRRVIAAKDKLKIPDDAPFALVTLAPSFGRSTTDVTKLVESIAQQTGHWGRKPGLIILDTLSRSIPGLDESRSDDIMVFVDNAMRLGQSLGATVVPIHHCGKDEDRGMRGSSALHGAADGEWLITRNDKQGTRTIVVQKMRDGQDRLSLDFSLKPAALGKDVDGDDMRTLVVDLAKRPRNLPAPLNAGEERTLIALQIMIGVEGSVPTAASPAPAGCKVMDEARFREAARVAMVLGSGAKAASYASLIPRHLRILHAHGMIGRKDGKLWLVQDGAEP